MTFNCRCADSAYRTKCPRCGRHFALHFVRRPCDWQCQPRNGFPRSSRPEFSNPPKGSRSDRSWWRRLPVNWRISGGCFDSDVSSFAADVGALVRQARLARRWTQRELARRARVSHWTIWAIETDSANVTVQAVDDVLDALQLRIAVRSASLWLADRARQVDRGQSAVIAVCIRRMSRQGWLAASEVPCSDGRTNGYIDLLAFHAATAVLNTTEAKATMDDLGSMQRTQAWYERVAWSAARQLGWKPQRVVGMFLLLHTEAMDRQLDANREIVESWASLRGRELPMAVANPATWPEGARGLALVDPLDRSSTLIRRPRFAGRRTGAPVSRQSRVPGDLGPSGTPTPGRLICHRQSQRGTHAQRTRRLDPDMNSPRTNRRS